MYSTVQLSIHLFINLLKHYLREAVTHLLHLRCKKRNDFKKVKFKALSCEKPLKTTSFLSIHDHMTLQISKCKNKWYKYGRFNGGVCTNTLFSNRHKHIYGYIYIRCQLKAFQSDTWSPNFLTLISTIKKKSLWRVQHQKFRQTFHTESCQFVKANCGFRAGLDVVFYFCVRRTSPAPASVALVRLSTHRSLETRKQRREPWLVESHSQSVKEVKKWRHERRR